MKTVAKGPVWWDRHFDRLGRQIRTDVRMAAHKIWNHAQARTHAILGDDCDAGDVMEVSVEAVSQYLDRRLVQPFSINIAGLLTIAFRRQLQKRWLKRQHIEFVGGAFDLEQKAHSPDWTEHVNRLIDLKRITDRLSRRSRRILLRRREGVDWKTIATELGIATSTCQNSFRQEVRQVQLDMLIISAPGQFSSKAAASIRQL